MTNNGGHELALAYREHVPTAEETVQAAALWAFLIVSAHDGTVDAPLFERLAAGNLLAEVPAEYPTAFRSCDPATTSQAVISDPFQCSDDCLVSMDDINKLLVDPLVKGLRALGALSPVYGPALQLTQALRAAIADPATAGQSIGQQAAAAISQGDAGALLTAIADGLGMAALIAAAVTELAGAGQVASAIAAIAACVGLGVYIAKLKRLADRIQACRNFKANNCACSGPACGCADLGESSRGVMCCAQGGPTMDGGWYLISGATACCVLNRSEYLNQRDVCYTPPNKVPGSCPSCKSNAECCDRADTVGPGYADISLSPLRAGAISLTT